MAASLCRSSAAAGALARCQPDRLRALAPCAPNRCQPHRQPVAVRAGPDEEEPFTADDLLKTADDLMLKIGVESSGEFPIDVENTPAVTEMVLHCDEHGCTIIPAKDAPPQSQEQMLVVDPNDMILWEGANWKLGCDRNIRKRDDFSAIIAGEGWSFMISQAEYNDTIKLLNNLRASVETIGANPDPDELTSLETETEHVWMQGRATNANLLALKEHWLNGGPLPEEAFSLNIVLRTKGHRDVEGFWSAATVMEVYHQVLDGQQSMDVATGAHA